MISLDTQRREKKAEILHLAEMHGCRNVRVFGSVATGENRPGSGIFWWIWTRDEGWSSWSSCASATM